MKWGGYITPGKIFSVLLLMVGASVAIYLDNANVIITAIGVSGGFYAVKKHEDRKMNENR